MDGRFLRNIFILSLLLSACGQSEQAGVFVTNESSACQRARSLGEYVVTWRDGRQSLERAENDSVFKKTFFEKNKSLIQVAEPNYKIELNHTASEPEQTPFTFENWGADAIGAETAWNQNYKGQDVVVAVVDTGVDLTHPQLREQIHVNRTELSGQPGVDDDNNGFIDDVSGYNFATNNPDPTDSSGHGTHVAGTVAAKHSAGPVLGIAPQSKILPVKFIDGNYGDTSGAIAGLNYAVSRGAKVINASWGSPCPSEALRQTLESLQNRNVVVVVAAANYGVNLSEYPIYPAVYKTQNLITIGAMDISGYRATFSNYGPLVDLLAPGRDIYSTYIRTQGTPTGYAYNSGTSMAAPHVAGMAAVLWSKKPTATAVEIKNAIVNSVELFPNEDVPRGRARLDRALNHLN